jgi:hypothetical protein
MHHLRLAVRPQSGQGRAMHHPRSAVARPLATEPPHPLRVAAAFTELAQAI